MAKSHNNDKTDQLDNLKGSDFFNGLMTKEEVADGLNCSTRSLDRWHTLRTGPPRFLVGGRVTYDRRDVVAWVLKQKSKTTLR